MDDIINETYSVPVFTINIENQPGVELATILDDSQNTFIDEIERYDSVSVRGYSPEGTPPQLRVTPHTDHGDDETYQFTITEQSPPRKCAYQWERGADDVPVVVLHAVYKAGFEAENLASFPEYHFDLERVRAITRLMNYLHDEYSHVPLIGASFEGTKGVFKTLEGLMRAKVVLADREYDVVLNQVIKDKYGGQLPDNVTGFDNPLQIAELVNNFLLGALVYLNATDDRRYEGEQPEKVLLDVTKNEFPQYLSQVIEEDDYVYVILMDNDGHIERFTFEAQADGAYTAHRHHQKRAHPYAINVMYWHGYDVVAYPDLEHGGDTSSTAEQIDRAVHVVETIEAEYGGDDLSPFVFATVYRLVHQLRLAHAWYEALGEDEFITYHQQACSESQQVAEQLKALRHSMSEDRWTEVVNSNPRLKAVIDGWEQVLTDLAEIETEAGWSTSA